MNIENADVSDNRGKSSEANDFDSNVTTLEMLSIIHSIHEKKEEFEKEYLSFSTKRRSCNYRRQLVKKKSQQIFLLRE